MPQGCTFYYNKLYCIYNQYVYPYSSRVHFYKPLYCTYNTIFSALIITGRSSNANVFLSGLFYTSYIFWRKKKVKVFCQNKISVLYTHAGGT